MISIEAVTDDDFESVVLGSDVPVVVDFWAEWCAPCVALAHVLDQLADELSGQVRFVKVDVDRNRRTARAYKINNLPALLFFDRGIVRGSLFGVQPKSAIREAVASIDVPHGEQS